MKSMTFDWIFLGSWAKELRKSVDIAILGELAMVVQRGNVSRK